QSDPLERADVAAAEDGPTPLKTYGPERVTCLPRRLRRRQGLSVVLSEIRLLSGTCSCTNPSRSSGKPADLGFVLWHRAASPVVSTARSLFLLSLWSAPSRRDTRPDSPVLSPSYATSLFLRSGCRRHQSGWCRQRLSYR